MTKPKITVLMPVYNGETYLGDAIESILGQTYLNFEFLIIDDGSTDRSAEIIRSYIDPRIFVLSNAENRGLVYSLNRGLQNAKGKYVARMDSDDICVPERLEKQITFMEKHPDIGICGTWIKTIGEKGGYTHKYLTDHDDIKANLLFNTSFAHPTVMIRKSVLEENDLRYDEADKFYFEDYSLWIKMSRVTKIANIPEVLLLYRVHKKSSSQINALQNRFGADNLRREQLLALGMNPSPEEVILHNSLWGKEQESIADFLKKEEAWLLKILLANKKTLMYSQSSLEKVIFKRWRTICGFNTSDGLAVWKKFIASPLYDFGGKKRYIDSLKIFLKSLIRK
ncbi:MAG: glycosyltransferase [Candidatus Taylorbacteria bacterium]